MRRDPVVVELRRALRANNSFSRPVSRMFIHDPAPPRAGVDRRLRSLSQIIQVRVNHERDRLSRANSTGAAARRRALYGATHRGLVPKWRLQGTSRFRVFLSLPLSLSHRFSPLDGSAFFRICDFSTWLDDLATVSNTATLDDSDGHHPEHPSRIYSGADEYLESREIVFRATSMFQV